LTPKEKFSPARQKRRANPTSGRFNVTAKQVNQWLHRKLTHPVL
jgi:hypothetical protein